MTLYSYDGWSWPISTAITDFPEFFFTPALALPTVAKLRPIPHQAPAPGPSNRNAPSGTLYSLAVTNSQPKTGLGR
jgi:hypothetical protein